MAFSPTPAATLWKYHTTESRTAVASVWSFSQAGNGCGAPSQAKRVFSSFRTPDCRPASELKILNVEQGGSRRRHWTGLTRSVRSLRTSWSTKQPSSVPRRSAKRRSRASRGGSGAPPAEIARTHDAARSEQITDSLDADAARSAARAEHQRRYPIRRCSSAAWAAQKLVPLRSLSARVFENHITQWGSRQ